MTSNENPYTRFLVSVVFNFMWGATTWYCAFDKIPSDKNPQFFSNARGFKKMGNILGGGGNSGGLSGSFSGFGGQSQCCDAVVDPITLLTVIGAIAGLAQFLRQAVIDNMIAAGRKRSTGIFNFVLQGN